MTDWGMPAAGGAGEAAIVLVFSLALVLGGALVLLLAQLKLWEARRRRTWPAVMGWVVRSQAQQVATDTGYVYRADIAYDYTVGARKYTGQRVRFAEPGYGPKAQRDAALLTVQHYPVGQPMAVYYDPRHPEHAVLERHQRQRWPALALVGGAMLAAGMISSLSWATALAAPLMR